jgi:hypothetical protein
VLLTALPASGCRRVETPATASAAAVDAARAGATEPTAPVAPFAVEYSTLQMGGRLRYGGTFIAHSDGTLETRSPPPTVSVLRVVRVAPSELARLGAMVTSEPFASLQVPPSPGEGEFVTIEVDFAGRRHTVSWNRFGGAPAPPAVVPVVAEIERLRTLFDQRAAASPPAADAGAAGTVPDASAPAAGACRSDADCHLAPGCTCNCLALGPGESAPGCVSPPCFRAPCSFEVAACDAARQRCVVRMRPRP